MAGQSSWNEFALGLKTPYSRCKIFCGTEKEARVEGPFYALDRIMMSCMNSMPKERRKIEAIICIDIRNRRRMPNFNQTPDPYDEMVSRGGECQCRYRSSERKMVQSYLAGKIDEDSSAIFVN